jgi:hypothetical protein
MSATGMSAMGQKRTLAPQKVMSVLPPKADIPVLRHRNKKVEDSSVSIAAVP